MQKASVNVTSKLRWIQIKGIECMKAMKRGGLVEKTLMNIKSNSRGTKGKLCSSKC